MYSIVHRPFTFNDIAGHVGIISELKSRSAEQNFSQVIVMEGMSGSGKSSISLIIAGILNCSNPVIESDKSYSPCGKCKSCLDIREERFGRDVLFMDASSMSKDDVLEIQNVVSTLPMYDRNRVIIIDEAQELSKAGKGATLKLLEKQRSNTYFILCTMNEKALDKAIKSRGQTYRLRAVNNSVIAEHLYKILCKEKLDEVVPAEFLTEGIFIIAENAGGNVREALQLLERAIYGKYYTVEAISNELGLFSFSSSMRLIFMLLDKNVDFFKDISSYDLKEFYYYSWKVLTGAKIYGASGYTDEAWKAQSLKKILKYDTFNDLMNVYKNIAKDLYHLNTNLFQVLLSEYYLSGQQKVSNLVRPVRQTK